MVFKAFSPTVETFHPGFPGFEGLGSFGLDTGQQSGIAPKKMGGGSRSRRALMARPRLLVRDEPSIGLSPLEEKEIFQTLEELTQEGKNILLS